MSQVRVLSPLFRRSDDSPGTRGRRGLIDAGPIDAGRRLGKAVSAVRRFRGSKPLDARPTVVESLAAEAAAPTAEEQDRRAQLTRIVAWTEPGPTRRPEREQPREEAEAS